MPDDYVEEEEILTEEEEQDAIYRRAITKKLDRIEELTKRSSNSEINILRELIRKIERAEMLTDRRGNTEVRRRILSKGDDQILGKWSLMNGGRLLGRDARRYADPGGELQIWTSSEDRIEALTTIIGRIEDRPTRDMRDKEEIRKIVAELRRALK